jgi:hypothetical protein
MNFKFSLKKPSIIIVFFSLRSEYNFFSVYLVLIGKKEDKVEIRTKKKNSAIVVQPKRCKITGSE